MLYGRKFMDCTLVACQILLVDSIVPFCSSKLLVRGRFLKTLLMQTRPELNTSYHKHSKLPLHSLVWTSTALSLLQQKQAHMYFHQSIFLYKFNKFCVWEFAPIIPSPLFMVSNWHAQRKGHYSLYWWRLTQMVPLNYGLKYDSRLPICKYGAESDVGFSILWLLLVCFFMDAFDLVVVARFRTSASFGLNQLLTLSSSAYQKLVDWSLSEERG